MWRQQKSLARFLTCVFRRPNSDYWDAASIERTPRAIAGGSANRSSGRDRDHRRVGWVVGRCRGPLGVARIGAPSRADLSIGPRLLDYPVYCVEAVLFPALEEIGVVAF